ncbi:MAG: dTMP kinase [Planctomycetota bacterium]
MAAGGETARAVFIDFEGIDGSGKTTLSNRLAQLLKERGIPVHHARDGGVFRSEISKEIRTLTRDPRHLRMSDVTEFLLYVARDAQMIDEFIRPKLLPGNVVFSDRYLYSAITHSHHARGLPREEVDSVLRLAARGLWPDLVVYCDVDPLTSRIRKKIQKIRERRFGDFGRKGLMGIGFREEMRLGFLRLAEEDPERWLVVDNAHGTIEESLEKICRRVVPLLESRGFAGLGDLAGSSGKSQVAVPEKVPSFADRVKAVYALEPSGPREEAVYRAFFEELERLAPKAPAYAALFLSGLDAPEANALRETIIDREPALVAHSLQGLLSPESMAFRRRLKGAVPVYVARSLAGRPETPETTALREELFEAAPAEVLLSMRGHDTEFAWSLRERGGKKVAREVLASLRGIDTERAWALREKYAKDPYLPALLESLGGLDTPEAQRWRERLYDEYLPWVLVSVRGVFSEWSWKVREDHVERAPKLVIRSIGRSDDPRAWRLRESAKNLVKEVLDSVSGMDSGPAWSLRMELRRKWPNTAVSSLGAGNQSERAWRFRWDMLFEHPDNLLLLKHVVRAILRTLEEEGEFLDEDDEGEFT